jgi:hypothetical protein
LDSAIAIINALGLAKELKPVLKDLKKRLVASQGLGVQICSAVNPY